MQRVSIPLNNARVPAHLSHAWQARRWYYTPKSRRGYSVRQVSPGDRRLLAEFVAELGSTATERDQASIRDLTSMLFDRVIVTEENAVAFAALVNISGADRVIGVCAYAPSGLDGAEFGMAVANSYREEQVGRTLLSTLMRHAKRVGVRRLSAEMAWSNGAMQSLATSMGFQVLPLQRDRNCRLLALDLK